MTCRGRLQSQCSFSCAISGPLVCFCLFAVVKQAGMFSAVLIRDTETLLSFLCLILFFRNGRPVCHPGHYLMVPCGINCFPVLTCYLTLPWCYKCSLSTTAFGKVGVDSALWLRHVHPVGPVSGAVGPLFWPFETEVLTAGAAGWVSPGEAPGCSGDRARTQLALDL